MEGRAAALGAGTVLNALATGTGAAFGIDVETRATVTLNPDADGVRGTIAEDPDGDTALIEHCVALATERWGDGEGGTVRTDSDVPLAAGLKAPARPPMRPCSRPVTRSGWRLETTMRTRPSTSPARRRLPTRGPSGPRGGRHGHGRVRRRDRFDARRRHRYRQRRRRATVARDRRLGRSRVDASRARLQRGRGCDPL